MWLCVWLLRIVWNTPPIHCPPNSAPLRSAPGGAISTLRSGGGDIYKEKSTHLEGSTTPAMTGLVAAMSMGVLSFMSLIYRSATSDESTNSSAAETWLDRMAKCNGVCPFTSCALTLAPFPIRNNSTSSCPVCAAQ